MYLAKHPAKRYISGFLAGQAVAYCEMVSRGVRLAGQIGVAAEYADDLIVLVRQEGCKAYVEKNGPDRVALWIYREPFVLQLIESLQDAPSLTSPLRLWAMGKLFGYPDREIVEFALTSTSAEESSSRLSSGKNG